MSKKGFNLFKKKENVLPNQSGNVGIEQVNNIEMQPVENPENANLGVVTNTFETETPVPSKEFINNVELTQFEQEPVININETPSLENITNNVEPKQESNNPFEMVSTEVPIEEEPPIPPSNDTSLAFSNVEIPSPVEETALQPEVSKTSTPEFGENVSGEFSTQETEQSIENQLASKVEEPVQTEKPDLMAAPQEEPQQEEVQILPPPEPGTINALNNLASYNGNIKEVAKKGLNKKPFIIVASILVLAVIGVVTFTALGGSKTFGKAPNDITVPEDDASHNIVTEEEDVKKTEEEDSNPSTEVLPTPEPSTDTNNNNNSNNNTVVDNTKKTYNYSSITGSVERIEGTKIDTNVTFDTFYPDIKRIIFNHNLEHPYDVQQANGIFTISHVGEVLYSLNVEVISGSDLSRNEIYVSGGNSNNYIILFVNKTEKDGEFHILDSNFQTVESGSYNEATKPVVTIDGIYFGVINCSGTKADSSKGPVTNVYKFDTKTGTKSLRYSNNYNNSDNYCS